MKLPTLKTERIKAGDTLVEFTMPAGGGAPQWHLRPAGVAAVAHRRVLPETSPELRGIPAKWLPMPAWGPDPLVHLKLGGDNPAGAFAQGLTMRCGPGTAALRFVERKVSRRNGKIQVATRLRHPEGVDCRHILEASGAQPVFRSRTLLRNTSRKPVAIEMATSFSLGGITPYAADDAPGRLVVHRFRSAWSAEGRLESRSVEDLHLERSWTGHGIFSERFGQAGSMPVRGFFPFVAVEDLGAGVVWGAELACPGSWQMEVCRRGDFLSISGGQADREFGQWWKTLQPGEEWEAPVATVACVRGGVEDLCARLVAARGIPEGPASEGGLPIIFNEWCSSWGNPNHGNLVAMADRLRGTPVKYLVIDDGWAKRPGGRFQQNGDWIIDPKKFPAGLGATCAAIRERGLVPGIWFEFEVCNEGSKAFSLSDHHLHRDGRVLQVGSRRFWDFRDRFTFGHLKRKVAGLVRENGIGYLKVDYNETIGPGVDGAESPGEGLRQHLEGVQEFFRQLRRELPDLVIENCSSGGHRLEPSFLSLCHMGSFSDAHETVEIPVIAASLQRLVPPRQLQVWAVLRAGDSRQRLAYSLAATFLGRMCLSGGVHDLSPAQWKLVCSAMDLYRSAAPVIRGGRSFLYGGMGKSWRHPHGWQAVLRTAPDRRRALLVAHSFGRPFSKSAAIPLEEAGWEIQGLWPGGPAGLPASIKGRSLELGLPGPFKACVAVLGKPGA